MYVPRSHVPQSRRDILVHGSLKEEEAHKYLKTLSERTWAALEDVHRLDVLTVMFAFPMCASIATMMQYMYELTWWNVHNHIIETEQFLLCTYVITKPKLYMYVHKTRNDTGNSHWKEIGLHTVGWLLVWGINCAGEYHKGNGLDTSSMMCFCHYLCTTKMCT